MPNEAYVVLAALVGALISFLSQRSQIQAENRKQERMDDKERRERLREKLENAHLLLSKVAAETSIPESYRLAAQDRVQEADYELHSRQSNEDLRTLQMVVDLYFPVLHGIVEKITSATSEYWKDLETLRSGQMPEIRYRIDELSAAIAGGVEEAKQRLCDLAKTVTGRPAQAAG